MDALQTRRKGPHYCSAMRRADDCSRTPAQTADAGVFGHAFLALPPHCTGASWQARFHAAVLQDLQSMPANWETRFNRALAHTEVSLAWKEDTFFQYTILMCVSGIMTLLGSSWKKIDRSGSSKIDLLCAFGAHSVALQNRQRWLPGCQFLLPATLGLSRGHPFLAQRNNGLLPLLILQKCSQ